MILRRSSIIIAILAIPAALLAFSWPMADSRLTSTFGESRWDHFHDGVDIVSPNPAVKAPADGTLVFMWDRTLFPLDNHPGGGNYKIVRHGDIYAVYMHMEDGNTTTMQYREGDPVGRMGNTGHSFAAHLHMGMYNGQAGLSVNPLTVLPPMKDEKPPVINALALHIGDKYVIIREGSEIRLTQHYPLLIDLYDVIAGREHLGVRRLVVIHNGKQVCEYLYDNIKATPSGPLMAGRRHDEIFDENGYYRIPGITYAEGLNTLEVLASDFTGNETRKTFTFNTRLDMESR